MKQREGPSGSATSAPSRGPLLKLIAALSVTLLFGVTGLAVPADLMEISLEDPRTEPVEENNPVVGTNRVTSRPGPSSQRHRSRWNRTLPGRPQTVSAGEQRLTGLGSVRAEHVAPNDAPAPRLC